MSKKTSSAKRKSGHHQKHAAKAASDAAIEAEILTYFNANPTAVIGTKILSKQLGYDRETYQIFCDVIHRMAAGGRLAKHHGNKFALLSPNATGNVLSGWLEEIPVGDSADTISTTDSDATPDSPSSEKLQRYTVGQTYEGRLIINPKGYGFVVVDGFADDVFVSAERLGPTMDGDTVRVRVLQLGDGSGRSSGRNGKRTEGIVESVTARKRTTLVGVLIKHKKNFFLTPDDARVSADILVTDVGSGKVGDKVVTEIIGFEEDDLLTVRVKEVLGKAGESAVEVLSIARSLGIDADFPKPVVDEANSIPLIIPTSEYPNRLDFREKVVFTIDPFDAKDFDDAISIESIGNDLFEVGVHIADVSHFVREGSELDKEAVHRGTSVYLVDRVIPMLPSRLSENVCSLVPYADRLTYSVIMQVTSAGDVASYDIRKTVIHSKRRFTYEEAEAVIDTGKGDCASEITKAWKLAQTLTKRRMSEGAIDFDTDEVKFKLDENGVPIQVIKKTRLRSMRLIEELMLLANKTSARHAATFFDNPETKLPSIYRIHDQPNGVRIKALADFAGRMGYSLDVKKATNDESQTSSKALQKLISDVRGTDVEFLINEVTLRTMAKAIYSERNIGHFGLGFDFYSHFTSPIRRYPDLLFHRLLFEYETARLSGKAISEKRRLHLWQIVPEIAKSSSDAERTATEAERESIKMKQVEYIANHIGSEFTGIISGVTEFGIYVKMSEILIEGLVHIKSITDDFYIFDAENFRLVGKRSGKRLRLGDSVKVRVTGVNEQRRTIDLALVQSAR
jgi:ribonuclease R